jgi:hypothetical protein
MVLNKMFFIFWIAFIGWLLNVKPFFRCIALKQGLSFTNSAKLPKKGCEPAVCGVPVPFSRLIKLYTCLYDAKMFF